MKIHKELDYEAKMRNQYNEFVPKLNNAIYKIKKYVGNNDDWITIERKLSVSMHPPTLCVCAYSLSREHFKLIKRALHMKSMGKNSSEYGITFTAEMDNDLLVRFSFELPDSCEIVKETSWDEVDKSDYRVNADGKVFKKTEVVVGVNCKDGGSTLNALLGGAE